MIVDTDYEGIVGAIDVQNYQTAFIQAKPVDGNPDTAVIEVKRAFDAGFRTPSSSFDPTKILMLDGSVILEIDVTKTAFLHFDVTTAQAGRKIEIGFVLENPMEGFVVKSEVDTEYAGIVGKFPVQGNHAAILAAPRSSVSTAEISLTHSVDETFEGVPFAPAVDLALDGQTIQDTHLKPGAWIQAVAGAAQSGLSVDLYMYLHKDPIESVSDYVVVEDKSDFPSPVDGVITLRDNTTYLIITVVDLAGDRLVCGQNTVLLGNSSENCRLKSTGLTGTALITSVYSLPIRALTIEADVALDLNGDGTTTAIDWFGVNFQDCGEVGTVQDYTNFIMSDSAFLNSSGLVFDGTIGTIGFSNSLFEGASGQTIIEIPATATVTRRFRIVYSSFVVLSGETGIDVSSSATIPDEGYILDTINFSGGGTYTAGVAHDDNKALHVNNRGVPNSAEIGSYWMNGNGTTTTIATVSTPVKAAGTTTANSVNQRFTHTDNRLTYSGARTRVFSVTGVASATSASSNKQIGFFFAKNGTVISDSQINITSNSSSRAEAVAFQTIVELDPTDYIEVFVENGTNSSNITVTDLNVTIQGFN